MTRKHFIKAAQQVAAQQDRATAQIMAQAFIALFREANPRFDTARFLSACGLEGDRA